MRCFPRPTAILCTLRLADERICIGPPPSVKSYLNKERIIQAAKETGAAAIHPGYGYLAESETFAKLCEDEGLVFIGPTPENLRMAGEKIHCKKMMKEAGVPVIPGRNEGVATIQQALLDRRGNRLSGDDQGLGRRRRTGDADLP